MNLLAFAGDSITHAGRDEAEPLGHGFARMITEQLRPRHAFNTGSPGWRAANVLGCWPDVLSRRPDLIVLLVGVNDAHRQTSQDDERALDDFTRDFESLLSASREGAALAVLDPFLVLDGHPAAEPWHRALGAVLPSYRDVVADAARTHGVLHVRTQDAFDAALEHTPAADLAVDPVHPIGPGHAVIARAVLDVLEGSRFGMPVG